MADFEVSYKIVREHEGGYANDKDDNGGETYKGIARNFWPNWKGWAIVDRVKLSNPKTESLDTLLGNQSELQPLVLSFFKTEFWDVLQLDLIKSQPIGTELFDTSVNMGIEVAATFLQDALNIHNNNGKDYPDINVDGKIGPVTIGYMNAQTRPLEVLKTLNVMQGARYIEICKRNPRMEKFYRSWLSRVSL